MMGSALYGLLLGLAAVGLLGLSPQPAGSVVFWSLTLFQAAHFGWKFITRTRLRWFVLWSTLTVALSVTMLVLAFNGMTLFHQLPLRWFSILVMFSLGGWGCWYAQRRATPAEWDDWKTRVEQASLWTILSGEHIPDMR